MEDFIYRLESKGKGKSKMTIYKRHKVALWVRNGAGAPTCSECENAAVLAWNETGGAWVMTPYCPFCGAEMGQEEDDDE